jgi:MoaA/NifB/PqqE/SkfB family radical SAM enzyme
MVRQDKFSRLPERFPLACQWEITCRCNLRCVMCYTDCFNRPAFIRQELSTSEIIRIMDEMADAGTLELCLTGGEPMGRPDFFDLYEHAVRRGFLVTLFTNATLITEREADRFAALPPHRIEISLHGTTAETFERVTQSHGSFRRCLDAVNLLHERRIPLTLKAVALTLNRHEILTIKSFADSLGMVRFHLGEELRPELDGGTAPFQYALSEHELSTLHRADEAIWQEVCRRKAAVQPPCRSGMRRFHIDAYGGLQLCSGNRRQSYDLRTGTFRDGFYRALPTFACEYKASPTPELLYPASRHA